LVAVAFSVDGREIGRDTLTSAGEGLRLQVAPECDGLRADDADLGYIRIEITDDDGIVRPLADREVTVAVTGAGTLRGFGSAEPVTVEGFSTVHHSTYYGRGLVVIRAGHEAGDATITATADGCEPVIVAIPVRDGEATCPSR
jgi:hypothetical protein